jgi:hypothetical protein
MRLTPLVRQISKRLIQARSLLRSPAGVERLSRARATFLRKYAYGAPVVEVIFGKQELMQLCRDAGLRLEREWPSIPYDVSEATGHHSATETYLFSV